MVSFRRITLALLWLLTLRQVRLTLLKCLYLHKDLLLLEHTAGQVRSGKDVRDRCDDVISYVCKNVNEFENTFTTSTVPELPNNALKSI